MNSIDNTLAERGKRYGEFPDHANITQSMKDAMQSHQGWHNLANDQKEALEMVAHKIGRIINGDPNYIDSWTDIIGYTRLVEKRLIDGAAQLNKMQDMATSAIAQEAKAHAADVKNSASAINDFTKTLADSKVNPEPELDRFDEKLICELKKIFGDNTEIIYVSGQRS